MQQELAPQASLCRFQSALGRVEACPEERCPFWEPGGAVLEGRCAFERLDHSDSLELAAWHLRIRRMLEAASTREQEQQAWRLFPPASERRELRGSGGVLPAGASAWKRYLTAVRTSDPSSYEDVEKASWQRLQLELARIGDRPAEARRGRPPAADAGSVETRTMSHY